MDIAMAIIHEAYQFYCGTFAENVRNHLEQAHGRPSSAYQLLRTAAMQAVHRNERVRGYLDAYGGWDKTAIDRELPHTWTNDPADISFWLSILLYDQLDALEPGVSHGLHDLWRTLDETLHCAGWDSVARNLLIRGQDFGVFYDQYVKDTARGELRLPHVRSYFAQIRPGSALASSGWLDLSQVVSFKHRMDSEEKHLDSIAKNADEREAIQRAFDILNAAVATKTATCLIVSG